MEYFPMRYVCVVSFFTTILNLVASRATNPGEEYGMKLVWANVNLTYQDPVTGILTVEHSEMGLYGSGSRTEPEWGIVVHVRTADNMTHGCSRPVNAPSERWIALVERGTCKFHDKIHNTAIELNASAVVIYNNQYQKTPVTMKHSVSDVVSVFISRDQGERLAAMVDNGTRVYMHISFSRMQVDTLNNMNRTSVLFVTVSFILLMMVSVAWLIFYYIQRFRFEISTKDRNSKKLMAAAKKALGKMEQKTLHKGDCETSPEFDLCAVCVEGYKVSETIRILPCRHIFHKSCIDPWLVERRNCPICKLDMLEALGIRVDSSRGSHESRVSTTTDFETPYFLVETSELLLHDNTHYANVSNQGTVSSTAASGEQLEVTQSLISQTSHLECNDAV